MSKTNPVPSAPISIAVQSTEYVYVLGSRFMQIKNMKNTIITTVSIMCLVFSDSCIRYNNPTMINPIMAPTITNPRVILNPVKMEGKLFSPGLLSILLKLVVVYYYFIYYNNNNIIFNYCNYRNS